MRNDKITERVRFGVDYDIILDNKNNERYICDSFMDAEKIYHTLCYQELKLKLMEAELRNSQYKINLLNTKLELIDDLIIQQIAEYCNTSYTPAGTSQTKNAYAKIDALKQFKKKCPLEEIKQRNKISALLKLRKELGLMTDEECKELNDIKMEGEND